MSIFNKVSGNKPRRNAFDLSYSVKTTMDMGKLYPIAIQEMVPGDTFKVGLESVVNLNPMLAPVYGEMSLYSYFFFVPYRLLWKDWETFITKGLSGDETLSLPKFSDSYKAIDSKGEETSTSVSRSDDDYSAGSLWDYFGFPTGVKPTGLSSPVIFPWRAYNLVYNEFFLAEDFQDPLNLNQGQIQRVNWYKDYFTSALPFAQRGTAGALDLSLMPTSAKWTDNVYLSATSGAFAGANTTLYPKKDTSSNGDSYEIVAGYNRNGNNSLDEDDALYIPFASGSAPLSGTFNSSQSEVSRLGVALNDNTVDVQIKDNVTVEQLRLMFAIQRWQELNARAGVRYIEFLRAQYGTSPRDDRLQRPEFIGGSKSPIIVSQVLQTANNADNVGTGNKYGQGITADSTYIGNYYASEFGILVGVAFVRPKTSYQDGINRQWLRNDTFDYFNPMFSNLGEQEILNEEIFAKDGDSDPTEDSESNRSIWGYCPRYNELRYNPSLITGKMRDTFDYWHLGRKFESLPKLNAGFLECNPPKRIFQVQNEDEFLCHFGLNIKALRPLPYMAVPHLNA